MGLFNKDAKHKGQKNTFGKDKVPAGQYVTEKFPVLTYGATPEIAAKDWTLTLNGLVESHVELTWADFMALPQTTLTADFHCVTTWSMLDTQWTGVHIKNILKLVALKPETKFVMVHCYGGYTTNMPLDVINDDDVLLCHAWQGKPLSAEHGGPCRLLVPKRYAWKSAKWIKGLEFMPKDSMGFWERNGYSNSADPWLEERYW